MKLTAALAGVCACAILTACSGGASLDSGIEGAMRQESSGVITNPTYTRYVVVLKNGSTLTQRNAIINTLTRKPTHLYDAVYMGFAGDLNASEVAQISRNPQMRFLEKDRVCYAFDIASSLPNPLMQAWPGADLFLGSEAAQYWSVTKEASIAQSTSWGVTRIQANQNTGKGAGVTVAVIDTGCDLSHPDLVPAYWIQNGKIISYNAIYPARPADDGQGHGTHCAGIVGARDNAIDGLGVAPQCKIIPIKVLSDTGSGAFSWMIAGINWAVANKNTYNIKVCSISLGGGGSYSPGEAAVDNATAAGLTMSIAAGNNYMDANNFTPARAATAITVSALNPDDTFAGYSNWGSTIEVIAPGSAIFNTYRKGGTATLSGTSMACPHVSGCCALWFDDHPSDTRNQVLNALQTQGESPAGGFWTNDPDGIPEKLVKAANL